MTKENKDLELKELIVSASEIYCSDFEGLKDCDAKQRLVILVASLDGVRRANKDLANILKNMCAHQKISWAEALVKFK